MMARARPFWSSSSLRTTPPIMSSSMSLTRALINTKAAVASSKLWVEAIEIMTKIWRCTSGMRSLCISESIDIAPASNWSM